MKITTRLLILLLFVLGAGLTVRAQDASDATPITFGATMRGTLHNGTPRRLYTLDALRGEYISIALRAVSGTLDPVLTIIDATGKPLLIRDDSAGEINAIVNTVRMPANMRYTIVVGRFAYALGSTSGDYELRVERIGVSPESGSALRFGDTVANTITDAEPQIYYTFRAQRGDIITLTMRRDSGTLDPFLRIVNASRQIIAENDDFGDSRNARVERFTVQQDGQYLIIASRYGGEAGQTTGNFLLTLQRADGSGLGVSPEVGIPLLDSIPDQRDLSSERWQRYYVFSARRDDIIKLEMNRIDGNLDPFLELLDPDQQPLINHDDIVEGINRNALIEGFRIPRDGVYTVIATRFERQAGTTIGRYQLTLTIQGNAYAAVPSDIGILEYGMTMTAFLDDARPELLVAFYGDAGDVVQVAMNRSEGNFLPTVTLLDRGQSPLVSSDPGSANARIAGYTLPAQGIYYLRMERQNGVGSGGFGLLLSRAD
jgi:hypothetical protein